MNKEYKAIKSGDTWYVYQFDVYRKLTAHAKLDNIRQIALWIEEQENYDDVDKATDICADTMDRSYTIVRSTTGVYSYSTENDK